jgi:hypothetical protein
VFCIFFLPINSIINPIGIYDETIIEWIKGVGLKLRTKFLSLWTHLKFRFVAKAEQPVEIEMANIGLPAGQASDR